jgi:hypothetical protein
MPVPSVIPIVHEAGYHTDTIGTYAGGQFLANFSGACRGEPGPRLNEEVLWYAYVHRFDDDGAHVSSEFRFVTTTPPDAVRLSAEERERGERELAALLDTLDGREYGDIAIRLFRVEHDGIVFGLIDETDEYRESDESDESDESNDDDEHDEDGEGWAELYPEGLGFHAPWNGEYDT